MAPRILSPQPGSCLLTSAEAEPSVTETHPARAGRSGPADDDMVENLDVEFPPGMMEEMEGLSDCHLRNSDVHENSHVHGSVNMAKPKRAN